MTVYINHNNPAKYQDLTMTLIRGGMAGQDTASLAAEWIINNRIVAWKGYTFAHLD